jgi:hypothetical protein
MAVPDGLTYCVKHEQARRPDKSKLMLQGKSKIKNQKPMLNAYPRSACSTSCSCSDICVLHHVLLAAASDSRVVNACGPKLTPCHTDHNGMVTELPEPGCRAANHLKEAKTALHGNERFASVKCVGKEFETLNGLLIGPHQNQQVCPMQTLQILRELMR